MQVRFLSGALFGNMKKRGSIMARKKIEKTQIDNITNEEAVIEETVTEEVVTEEAVTEEAATEGTLIEEAVIEEAATEETVIEETATEEAAIEEIAIEEQDFAKGSDKNSDKSSDKNSGKKSGKNSNKKASDGPKMVEPHKSQKNPLPADEDLDIPIVTGETSKNSKEVRKASNELGSKTLGTTISNDTGRSSSKSSIAKEKKEFKSGVAAKKASEKKSGEKKSVEKKRSAKSEIKETGQFGKGHTTTKKSFFAYIGDDLKDFGRWCKKNYSKSIPIGIGVVLVIILVVILIQNATIAKSQADIAAASNAYEDVAVDKSQTPVEENAYDFVNQFINKYYSALASGDGETFASLRNKTDETDEILMSKKAAYIDSYNVISVYTKPGPADNSFIAYVYYEVKFDGFDTPAPGMNTFYIQTDENGNLFIDCLDQDEATKQYIEKVSAEEDVADLFNKVQVNYNDVVDSDESLKAFLEGLAVNLKNDVGEELAILAFNQPEEETQEEEPEESTQEQEAEDEGNSSQNTPGDTAAADTKETVCTTDRVNVRSEASSDSQKIGTADRGATLTRLENRADGWSKVVFEGGEGYIRSDLLTVVETPKGYVKTTDKVNVRKEPGTDAPKLGVVSSGTIIGLAEHRSDGWSRVIYNGESGYIKTEFLEDVAMEQ